MVFYENQPAGERHDYRQDPFDCTVQAEKGFDEEELDLPHIWLLDFTLSEVEWVQEKVTRKEIVLDYTRIITEEILKQVQDDVGDRKWQRKIDTTPLYLYTYICYETSNRRISRKREDN